MKHIKEGLEIKNLDLQSVKQYIMEKTISITDDYKTMDYHLQTLNGSNDSYDTDIQMIASAFEEAFQKFEIAQRDFNPVDKSVSKLKLNCLSKVCQRLCSAKVYIPTESNGSRESKRNKRVKLLNQSRTIELFWMYIKGQLCEFIEKVICDFLKKVNLKKNKYDRELIDEWDSQYAMFKSSLGYVQSIIEYTKINYPQVTKEINAYDETFDFCNFLYIKEFKKQMKQQFKPYIECWIYERSQTIENDIKNKSDIHERYIFLRIINSYIISIDGIPFNTLYCNFARESVKQVDMEQGTDFIETFEPLLKKITILAWSFDSKLVNKINDVMIEAALLTPGRLSNVLNGAILKSTNSIFISTISSYFMICRKQCNIFVSAYESRELHSALNIELRTMIRNGLQPVILNKKSLDSPDILRIAIIYIQLMCTLKKTNEEHDYLTNALSHVANKFTLLVREEVSNVFGGDMKVIEVYQKLCEMRLKGNLFPHSKMDIKEIELLLCVVPYYLKIDKVFLSLHEKYLFRKIIMNGPATIDTIKASNSFEAKLLLAYETLHAKEAENQGFNQFINEVRQCSHSLSLYQNHTRLESRTSKIEMELVPLVFAKSNIPSELQEQTMLKPKLPIEMKNAWSAFEMFYKTEKNAEFKKINQLYALHHCEVSTPFELPDRTFLVFELTLTQSLLLNLFNDNDFVSFNDIVQKLEIDQISANLSLKSFVDILLVKKNEDNNYELNYSYKPDIRKVKGNNLRISLPRSVQSIPKPVMNKSVISSSQHKEGHSAQWKLELLKAAIVRSLKGELNGHSYDELISSVERQISGFSIGEFKEALHKALSDGAINQDGKRFFY